MKHDQVSSNQRTLIRFENLIHQVSGTTVPHRPHAHCILSETDQGEDVGITSTGPGPWSGVVKSAMDFGATTSVMLTGGAKMAYGSVTGNEEAFKAGKEAVYGKGS